MKKIISLIGILVGISTAQAQYVTEALRYSQNFPTLTARSISMGGAFTSLGGDFASSYVNPAGLGLYRKSEFSFTPSLSLAKTTADYIGQDNSDYKYQFAISNFGYVGTYRSNRDKGLVSASYAIGYNRLQNFNNNTIIRGTNVNSSYSDYFVESSDRVVPEDLNSFGARLLYDAWVIDTVDYIDLYESLVPLPIDQYRKISSKGGIGEWTFAFGLNFSDRLYFGMGLGITQLKYEQNVLHSETNYDTYYSFRSFDMNDDLKVEGTGISLKLGLTARITEGLRIGTALNLPTFYNISEEYYSTVYSVYDNETYYKVPTANDNQELGPGVFEYKLNTPLKLAGGLSYQIGKAGIITGDVEYVNYASIKMRNHDDFNGSIDRQTVDQANSDIEDVYCSVINLKLGGELRFGDFSIRAGGGYYPSPYVSGELNEDASYTMISSGVGYRNNNFFFDMGFSGIFHKENYNLYTSANRNNIASLNQPAYRFLTTIGFRF
jgi:hypothetical protein